MNTRWLLMLCVSALLVSTTGCGSKIKVDTQHSQGINFDLYRTYAWHPQGLSMVGIDPLRAQSAHDTIRGTVDSELAGKGIKRAAQGSPDFFVATTIGALSHSHATRWGNATGGFPLGSSEVPLNEEEIREGSIVLDFIDNQSGVLIWRGTAHGVVSPTDDRKAKLETAIRSMLDRFPPKANTK